MERCRLLDYYDRIMMLKRTNEAEAVRPELKEQGDLKSAAETFYIFFMRRRGISIVRSIAAERAADEKMINMQLSTDVGSRSHDHQAAD
jgi:hypothetical protein